MSVAADDLPIAPTSTPWNTGTAERPADPPPDQTPLELRIYRGTGDRPDWRPRMDDRGYAVDVTAVMTRCADGSELITALVVGGRTVPLDATCPVTDRRAPDAPVVACDAKRWNCPPAPRS